MKIRTIESCGSTNEELKKEIMTMTDASPLPAAVLAFGQTAGKGRRGRSFCSPPGKGLYLSIPYEISSPADALCVMPMTSICVSMMIEETCGISCGIKWPNDVLCNGRKLCGILTELAQNSGRMFLVIGIGVNLAQEEEDFGPELKDKAVSLKQVCGQFPDPQSLAKALVRNVGSMIKALPDGKADLLEYYRSRCTALGKNIDIFFSEGAQPRKAKALDITDDFRLLVQWEDGSTEALNTGEVSVR